MQVCCRQILENKGNAILYFFVNLSHCSLIFEAYWRIFSKATFSDNTLNSETLKAFPFFSVVESMFIIIGYQSWVVNEVLRFYQKYAFLSKMRMRCGLFYYARFIVKLYMYHVFHQFFNECIYFKQKEKRENIWIKSNFFRFWNKNYVLLKKNII